MLLVTLVPRYQLNFYKSLSTVKKKMNIYSKLLCLLLLTCAVDFSRFAHVGLAVITLLDIVLVSRLHVQYGIADKYMVLWGSALGDAINQFKYAFFSCEPSSSVI